VPAGARFCPSCGRPVGEASREEERKLVTVLFADLVGSTAVADARDPERVARILDSYATAMREVLEGWGGTVEKYIGDAVVAAFGVPAVREDDASRALHAALEMLERLEALNDELEPQHGLRLALRIGVNTGEVLAATASGLDQRFLAGDVVNVAARLEQGAEPGTILVGSRTAEAAGSAFRFDPPAQLQVKGKEKSLPALRVSGTSDLATAAGTPARRLQAPLIGRERELRALDEALDDVLKSPQARLALVVGPAGIGKSRLVFEFLERARTRMPALNVLRGRCLSSGHGITYWALGEIVRQASGISLDTPPDEAATRLEEMVGSLFGQDAEGQADIGKVVFAMATTAGIYVADNPLDRIRPIAVANELGRAWPRFASAEARRAPTVLFIEDLHWADDQLLATLEHIVGRSEGPLLVLTTARPEFVAEHPAFAAAREAATSVSLRALDERDEEKLVEALLGWESLPPALRRPLLERAEGNPFFLEQLVDGLIDAGAVARDGNEWQFRSEAPATLPDTIHGVLASRIDRLSSAEKRALQEASVVGRTFWAPALAEAMDEAALIPALDGLEAKGLIVVRSTSSVAGEAEYMFKHALLREVALTGIPLARRARSHARAGAWLERLAGEGDEAVLEVVADHYRAALLGDGADLGWTDAADDRARVRDRAFAALLAAGAGARRRNATQRAIDLHEAALQLAADDLERARSYEELGDDHGWSYHGDPSVDNWTRSLEVWRAIGDDEACARVCLKAARHCAIYWGGFANRPPGAMVDSLVDEGLDRTRDPLTRGWLLAIRGLAAGSYAALSHPDPRSREWRIAAAEEAASLGEREGSIDLQAIALRSLGGLYLEAGQPERALELAEKELAILDRVDALRDRLVQQSLALARVMDIGGDFERALALAKDAKALARDQSAHERMHATYFVMAPLYRLGRWQEIVPLVEEHLAAFEEETVDMNCPYTRGGPALGAVVLDRLGLVDAAAAASQRIVPNEAQPGLVEAWMAERALLRGDAAGAREIVERVLAFGRGPSFEEPPYEVPVLVEALASEGDWTALESTLPIAPETAASVCWIGPATERATAARSAAEGHPRLAQASLKRALESYRRLGMRAEEAATVERLAQLAHGARAQALASEAAALWAEVTGTGG
jgi:class 3 adenylate cyclase/tetratricopeptide (TPR) repeat protein